MQVAPQEIIFYVILPLIMAIKIHNYNKKMERIKNEKESDLLESGCEL